LLFDELAFVLRRLWEMQLNEQELKLLELLVGGGRPQTLAPIMGISAQEVAGMILDLARKVEPLSLGQAMEEFKRGRTNQ